MLRSGSTAHRRRSSHDDAASRTDAPTRTLGSIWKWIVAALAAGVAIGVGLGLTHGARHAAAPAPPPTRPNVAWPPGARKAPDFRLVDQRGAPISLRLFRGRFVILTFIDPLCRTLCPLEAKVLNDVVAGTPPAARPAIVAVSVNPWGDSRAAFRRDARKWRLVPQWRWAAGRYGQLARVWKRYEIGVLVRTRVVNGIAVHDVSHTEASFVIDPAGYERALFLYPFRAEDLGATMRQVARDWSRRESNR